MNFKINILDENTINKIAAGEVVERPSSIVKELIENSIDAAASRITIEIEDGGKKLIRVTDNGTGIDSHEVEKAFQRHATSKILNIDDLYNLNSLGFRGEALASIASVSEIEVITKTENDKFGTKLYLSGGSVIKKEPIGCSIGTTIIVKNLFFNTPARRKFLKPSNAETLSITDIINKICVGNPNIKFKYVNNNKIMLTTPGDDNLKNTIRSVYGKNIADNLISISTQNNYFKIYGFVGNNSIYRSNKSMQHIYVNGRYVKTTLILDAISDAYKSILPVNKHAICFLNIQVDPKSIDVNIHPTKLEVKFENENELYKFIKQEIYASLIHSSLIPKFEEHINDNLSFNSVELNSVSKEMEIKENLFIEEQITIPKYNILEDASDPKFNILRENSNIPIDSNAYLNNSSVNESEFVVREDEKTKLPDLDIIGNIFNTYIVARSKESMFLIDQHAAHEKIIYEEYLYKLKNSKITSQILIDPIVLDLSTKDILIIKDKLSLFEEFGFEIDLFGNNRIIIRSIPNLFGQPESERFIIEIIDNISIIENQYELRKDKVASIACKAAVKAKDFLNTIEMDALIKKLRLCENPYTCPHGRPIIVEIKKSEIEKMFKRII